MITHCLFSLPGEHYALLRVDIIPKHVVRGTPISALVTITPSKDTFLPHMIIFSLSDWSRAVVNKSSYNGRYLCSFSLQNARSTGKTIICGKKQIHDSFAWYVLLFTTVGILSSSRLL